MTALVSVMKDGKPSDVGWNPAYLEYSTPTSAGSTPEKEPLTPAERRSGYRYWTASTGVTLRIMVGWRAEKELRKAESEEAEHQAKVREHRAALTDIDRAAMAVMEDSHTSDDGYDVPFLGSHGAEALVFALRDAGFRIERAR